MSQTRDLALPLVLIGAGGHARVVHALALSAGHRLVGVCDPTLHASGVEDWQGLPVLGGDEALERLDPTAVALANGIGQLAADPLRELVYQRIRHLGFSFPPLVHAAAWVADDAELADGVQVMAGAIVQPGCRIGANCIVNTRAGIDHDCRLGAHVHVAPGATLCGGVTVADGAFIGAGATLIQGLCVGAGAVVGAGTTVRRHVEARTRVVGAPARVLDGSPAARR